MLEKQERAENGDIDEDEEETSAPAAAAADGAAAGKPEVSGCEICATEQHNCCASRVMVGVMRCFGADLTCFPCFPCFPWSW